MSSSSAGRSAVLSELDQLVEDLTGSRALAARAFAAEMFFFERVGGVVEERERERAVRDGNGAVIASSQLGMREVYAEVAAALRLSEWQVARKVSQAWSLTHRFYQTLCEASDGRIWPEHATLIAETGAVIEDDQVRRQYEAVALDMAGEMTPAQLRPALSGLVSRLDPEGTQQRVRDAVKRRRVTVRELEPGLARITADLPTAQGVGIVNRLQEMADQLYEQNAADRAQAQAQAEAADANADANAGADPNGDRADADANADADPNSDRANADTDTDSDGVADGGSDDAESGEAESEEAGSGEAGSGEVVFDERTRSQIMADVFCDLLLTNIPDGHGTTEQARENLGAITGTVQVTIPARTLTGETVGGGEVVGFGAIDDDTARDLAGTARVWTRVFTDPCTGVPTSVDRYRPSKRQRLLLRVRDEHCRFPGCRRPAHKCDIDHTTAYADGGTTCLCNLAHLCKRHHTLKHETDWTVIQLPGGILEWTAPTGRIHHTRPPGTVRFQPITANALARDPAPF
ncbi:HNH endonuclease signature motif containing protein [Microbacterium elymi]|uniref:HNH endonuclease n=1 Tax=Microbacterium elymi TaxID=2909587 RepID=A0ABY5NKJ9_9MICO|nr:HNH endonuclease signature motif containing protein [Microbacterium elymi]UUT35664.1 HNH endonuclease [Microbacterium elymi]